MEEEARKKALGRMMKEDLEFTPSKFMAEHTVAADETLSHIALKYYGSAVKDKWMIIYEANKAVIGDDPGRIRPGQVLKIPELPK
jgi:nucleoid-associated protein YgaU